MVPEHRVEASSQKFSTCSPGVDTLFDFVLSSYTMAANCKSGLKLDEYDVLVLQHAITTTAVN